ncbi:MAG: DsbA family protein [Rhodospirillaceae bacterium]
MAEPIRFYFDFNSTFSYIAVQRIDDVAARHNREVDWIAVSLGHLFKAQGITPPPLIPAKFAYLATDFRRSCAEAGLPAHIPDPMPPPVKLARLAFWRFKAKDTDLARAFAKAVTMAVFGKGDNVGTAAEIARACAGIDGVSETEIAAASDDESAKQAVIQAVDMAKADGMIGAPFMVLEGEPFWGADRLNQLERRLAAGK